ncbi:hypothetical protein [Micromonospora sp. NPDC093277]|uniref:hypothetical protein n=1 Tax=Micromonospora sp. NPDC093277 TaxID=3364291 RepID=UPI00382137BF
MAINDERGGRGTTTTGHVPITLPVDPAPRRRRVTVVAVTAIVALALTSGCSLRRPAPDQAAPESPAAAETPADGSVTVPWVSAMVARSGTDITVYSGPGDVWCKELWQPQATISEQQDAHVIVSVNARIIDAVDCASSGNVVPLVVSLSKPLGDRVLRDAATGSTPPIYSERELPDLRSNKRWSPFPSHWMSPERSWHQGYNGPEGLVLLVNAQRTTDVVLPDSAGTVTIGSRQGIATGDPARAWTVWWEVGEMTYSLRLSPAEGGTSTLKQFKQELAALRWS